MSPEKNTPNLPIYSYTHPEMGTTVDLVGMQHIGASQIFERVKDFLWSRHERGAAIHFEGVSINTPEEMAQASALNRFKARRIAPVLDLDVRLSEGVQGLAVQTDTWLPPTAECHDVSVLDIAQRLSLKQTLGFAAVVGLGTRLAKRLNDEEFDEQVTAVRPDETEPQSVLLSKDGPLRAIGEVLIDYRSDYALGAFDTLQQERPGNDACLVWGQLHLVSLGEGLERRGYKRVPTQHYS